MDTLLRRREMMQGGDAPVFVDWIKGDGNAYIALPYTPTMRSSLIVDLVITGNFQWGSRQALNNKSLELGYNGSKFLARMGSKSGDRDVSSSLIFGKKTRWTLSSNSAGTSGFCKLVNLDTGVTITEGTVQENSFTGVSPIIIFGFNNGGTFMAGNSLQSLYHAEFRLNQSEANTHILNPCLYHGEYGLWDLWDNVFRGNAAGVGTITGGYDE